MLQFRTIDTCLRDGRTQVAFGAALVDLHKTGAVPDTVRFFRSPPTALIGRHQALRHAVDVALCRNSGIAVARRVTGGGVICLHEGCLGWEIVLSRRRVSMPSLGDYARAIGEAVAHGLAQGFDIAARVGPRYGIEVGGRALCGIGGFFDRDTVSVQGTVPIDDDPPGLCACLVDSAAAPSTTLNALLGGASPDIAAVQQSILAGLAQKLGIEVTSGTLSEAEQALAQRLFDETIGTDAFVCEIDEPRGAGVGEASVTGVHGTASAYVHLEGAGTVRRLRQIRIAGDFLAMPPSMVPELETALRGTAAAEIGAAVDTFFAASRPDLLTVAPADFREVIEKAVATGERE